MKQNRKLKSKKRVKRKEAEIMGFKLIINNQGQFITEIKNYPMDKINLHFHKNNAGVITAMLRECKTNFTDLSEELEKIAREQNYFVERKLYPNIDFYSGITLRAMGIPVPMFTAIFTLGRMPGWITHWTEMVSSPFKIARPRQLYLGSQSRDYVSIDKR